MGEFGGRDATKGTGPGHDARIRMAGEERSSHRLWTASLGSWAEQVASTAALCLNGFQNADSASPSCWSYGSRPLQRKQVAGTRRIPGGRGRAGSAKRAIECLETLVELEKTPLVLDASRLGNPGASVDVGCGVGVVVVVGLVVKREKGYPRGSSAS